MNSDPGLTGDGAEILVSLPRSEIGQTANGAGDRYFRVALNTRSKQELLAAMETRLAAGQGFAAATLNLDHIVKLQRSAAFRDAYASHSHVVADGNPVVWIARLAGRSVELTPGSELVEPVAALAARMQVPLGLFGATDEVLERSAAGLQARCPGLEVSDRIAPPWGFDPEGAEADACIARMGAARARLWLLALGAPKQEIFAARAWAALPHLGFLSVGAGIDFIAGSQTRAPRLVRSLASEWIWRMAHNPRRLGPRYARCLAVLPTLAWTALQQRQPASRP